MNNLIGFIKRLGYLSTKKSNTILVRTARIINTFQIKAIITYFNTN